MTNCDEALPLVLHEIGTSPLILSFIAHIAYFHNSVCTCYCCSGIRRAAGSLASPGHVARDHRLLFADRVGEHAHLPA